MERAPEETSMTAVASKLLFGAALTVSLVGTGALGYRVLSAPAVAVARLLEDAGCRSSSR